MNKNTLLAFLLIGLILILWGPLQKMISPPKPQSAPERVVSESPYEKTQYTKKSSDVIKKPAIIKEKVIDTIENEVPAIQEKFIKISSRLEDDGLYTCIISTKGGTIKDWTLKKYKKRDGSQLSLVKNNNPGNLGIGFISSNGDTIDTAGRSFEPVGFSFDDLSKLKDDTVNVYFNRSGKAELHLVCRIDDDKSVEKIFKFEKDKYPFELDVKLNNLKDVITDREYWISWDSGLTPSEKKFEDDSQYSEIFAMMGDELESLNPDDTELKTLRLTGDTKWIALRSKYFATAIIPMSFYGKEAILSGRVIKSNKEVIDEDYYGVIKADFSGNDVHSDTYKVLIGPLEYPMITELSVDLEKIMGFGWKFIRPISKLIYHILRFLYNYIENYGMVIIIFSILIKILFYPLTRKSYVSMKKMQDIQPLMTELRKKHKKDPQKLNKAMMRLYKEQKVNPLGGCLPLLFQMPVFIAMYPLFYQMIEFRGAKFALWINDLSSPDTVAQLDLGFMTWNVNPLVLIWVASMFFQNKLTMKDPKQKMMVYLMPIMMLVFFNNLFSSGLVLYWTVFNLLTTIQQLYTKK